jgi:hypothetical protein
MINKFNIFLCLNALLISSASLAMESQDFIQGRKLSIAAGAGDLSLVKKLLTEGTPVDARGKGNEGWTPLAWAAFKGHKETCQFLLDYKAQADAKNKHNETPLTLAAMSCDKDICHLLINSILDRSILLPGAMITFLGIKKFHKSAGLKLIEREIIKQIVREAKNAVAPKIKNLFAQIDAIRNVNGFIICKDSLRIYAQQQLKMKMNPNTNGDSHE